MSKLVARSGREFDFPDVISIGGLEYNVRQPHEFTESVNLAAQISYGQEEIRVSMRPAGAHNGIISERMAARHLLHEVVHAIGYSMSDADLRDDENIVDRVASGMCWVLHQNPQVAKFLYDVFGLPEEPHAPVAITPEV